MAETVTQKRVVRARPNPAYRKSTLRKMSPVTRQLARLIGEQVSVTKRLKNLMAKVKEMELRDIERQQETQAVVDRLKGG